MRKSALLLLCVGLGINLFAQPLPLEKVEAWNEEMEEAFRQGKPLELAALYVDSAMLLSPGGHAVTGRTAIDDYWTALQYPVDWDLTVLAASGEVDDLYEHARWQALKQKPPLWEEDWLAGFDCPKIYQLGHSLLSYRNQAEGKIRRSHVDFILIWGEVEPGKWRILLDTYAANGPL